MFRLETAGRERVSTSTNLHLSELPTDIPVNSMVALLPPPRPSMLFKMI